MPELIEVRVTVEKLRERCRNKTLVQVIVYHQHNSSKTLIPELEKQIFPTKCLDVLSIGKQIFFFFDSFVLNSGMGMSGHWLWDREHAHTKLVLRFGEQIDHHTITDHELYFDETRPFSLCFCLSHDAAQERMKKLGIDLLNGIAPWSNVEQRIPQTVCTLEVFQSMIKGKQRLDNWLLRQDIIGGIGNYLKSEICYVARISPFRTLDMISREEIIRLYDAIITVITQAYKDQGYTFGDFIDPDGQKGRYVSLVYKRLQDPLGNPITRVKGTRSTFVVESLQK